MEEWARHLEIVDEISLAALALALGAERVGSLSPRELRIARAASAFQIPATLCRDVREQIRGGEDPLGELFCGIRAADQRREAGATFTPPLIVREMIDQATEEMLPGLVIDPGAGSGRFLVAAGKRFPRAQLLGVEKDPLAALLLRGHVAATGLARRSNILARDYCSARLPASDKRLFIGNPPYVRHHALPAKSKQWLARVSRQMSLPVSGLAGLYVHFLLATARRLRAGDWACLITAGEWLDVNYGSAVRRLLLDHVDCRRISVFDATKSPFLDAATTSTILQFTAPQVPSEDFALERVQVEGERLRVVQRVSVSHERARQEPRWRRFWHPPRDASSDLIPLGEFCRVKRGQVTGANRVWVLQAPSQLPQRFLFPAITRAQELFSTAPLLTDDCELRLVVDLPTDLSELSSADRRAVDRFLRQARRQSAHQSYVARHRKSWWSVGLYDPAPILATYMARRPPAFVRNAIGARHINIAHGLYPKIALTDQQITGLTSFLNAHVSLDEGRVYAGGLTKFEPKEMERLLVPRPEDLSARWAGSAG